MRLLRLLGSGSSLKGPVGLWSHLKSLKDRGTSIATAIFSYCLLGLIGLLGLFLSLLLLLLLFLPLIVGVVTIEIRVAGGIAVGVVYFFGLFFFLFCLGF